VTANQFVRKFLYKVFVTKYDIEPTKVPQMMRRTLAISSLLATKEQQSQIFELG
jgi:hypothetical protein